MSDETLGSRPAETLPDGARLLDAIEQLNESLRDAARRTAALDARIDALPGPEDIAVAVEAEVQRSVRLTRDEIDARVGSLGARLDALARRMAEIVDALVPLEGLRTEMATVADEHAGLREIKARIDQAIEQLSQTAARAPEAVSSAQAAEDEARFERFIAALQETAAGIRTDFEILVRGELQASERRSDALGLRITNLSLGVTKALEDLVGETKRLGERARSLEAENAAILQAVKEEVAAMSAGGADAVRARIEALDATFGSGSKRMLEQLTERIGSVEARIAEGMAALEARLSAREPAGFHEAIAEMNDRLAALSRAEPASFDTAVLTETVERARAAVERAAATIEEAAASLERAGEQPAEAQSEQIAPLIEQLRDQLVTRTAGVNAQIVERAARLEELIVALPSASDLAAAHPVTDLAAAMPTAEDVGAAVADRVAAVTAGAKRETDGRLTALDQELGGIAANVNEIWIRVRALVKGLEDERHAAQESATTTATRLDELAAAEERLRARLTDAERGLVETFRTIETERDRVFLATLGELLEKLPRRERKLFRKRVQEIAVARAQVPEPAQPTSEPAAPAPPDSAAESAARLKRKANEGPKAASSTSSKRKRRSRSARKAASPDAVAKAPDASAPAEGLATPETPPEADQAGK
ncbi:MAG: hypothetical protein ACXVP8_01695 [Actinomycetota bacterium]